jgi:hypothetical protein
MEFTRLVYTGLVVELEHRKIETRLIDYKLRLWNLHASYTLGWSWNWNT